MNFSYEKWYLSFGRVEFRLKEAHGLGDTLRKMRSSIFFLKNQKEKGREDAGG